MFNVLLDHHHQNESDCPLSLVNNANSRDTCYISALVQRGGFVVQLIHTESAHLKLKSGDRRLLI